MRRFVIPFAILTLAGCSQESDPTEITDQAIADMLAESVNPEVVDVPEAFADYLGAWKDDDDTIRQVFIANENTVTACMLVPAETGGWVVISSGAYVPDTDPRSFSGEFSGQDMGFSSLSVTGYPVPGGGLDFINRANVDGQQETSYETWSAPLNGRFTYILERDNEINGRDVLMAGEWIRIVWPDASCET